MTAGSPSPTLRAATPSDDRFFLALYQTTRAAEPGWSAIPESVRLPLLESQFRLQIASYARDHPGLGRFVVLAGGEAVGRLDVARRPDALLLVEIALLPDWRRRGIGSALVRGLLEEARAGKLPVRLHVWHDTGVSAFYRRLGFEVVEPGVHGDRMEREFVG